MEQILIMILGIAALPLMFTNEKAVETQKSNTYKSDNEDWRRKFGVRGIRCGISLK